MPKAPRFFKPGIKGIRTVRRTDPEQDNRPTAAARGYGSRWQKARATFLKKNPLCRECEEKGKTVPATVVDHIIPARLAPEKFWDKTNWQPLCSLCHNRKTIRENRK